MKDIRVAAVVMCSPLGQTDANLDRMEAWTAAACKAGAALVCFPEMNITGYGIQPDIAHSAESIHGPICDRLRNMARSHDLVIMAGMAERGLRDHLYASHLIVRPTGGVEVYRKTHIAPPERPVFTPGAAVPVFEARGIRFGIQLCYDLHFPELATRMALAGAEVIFCPHASPRGTPEEKHRSWLRHLPARAFDNGLFVVACNQCGKNGQGLDFPGLALALGPAGHIMAADVSGHEGLLVLDLKKNALEGVRRHPMRYFLPNRRPELYGA